MITENENNWHYLTIKNTSLLFRRVTSNNKGNFYSLNCLHSHRTKNALKRHERLCNNHDHCEVIMPTKDKNTLEFTSHEKIITYAAYDIRRTLNLIETHTIIPT